MNGPRTSRRPHRNGRRLRGSRGRSACAWFATAATLLAGLTLAACEVEQRIVKRGGVLRGLPGAEGESVNAGRAAPIGRSSWEQLMAPFAGPIPGEPIEGEPLRRRMPDGSIHLISRSPQQLVTHLRETIERQEYDLLFDQLVSEHTKRWYGEQGEPPETAVEYLRDRETAVLEFLRTVPQGDRTPNATLEPAGSRRFKLRTPGWQMVDMRFTTLTMRIESGRFVLEGLRGS